MAIFHREYFASDSVGSGDCGGDCESFAERTDRLGSHLASGSVWYTDTPNARCNTNNQSKNALGVVVDHYGADCSRQLAVLCRTGPRARGCSVRRPDHTYRFSAIDYPRGRIPIGSRIACRVSSISPLATRPIPALEALRLSARARLPAAVGVWNSPKRKSRKSRRRPVFE